MSRRSQEIGGRATRDPDPAEVEPCAAAEPDHHGGARGDDEAGVKNRGQEGAGGRPLRNHA